MEKACAEANVDDFKFLYDVNASIKDKIMAISKEIYGAKDVEYTDVAEKQIEQYKNCEGIE